MADHWGIEERYVDAGGTRRRVRQETLERLRQEIGRPVENARAPIVVRPGGRIITGPGRVELEDGQERGVDGTLPGDLPLGYHRFVGTDGSTAALIATPGRCHLPERRAWGWAVQLYAARTSESWGMGDLGDLEALGSWSSAAGAGFVLLNPLGAVALRPPQQTSPYFPATRRFFNPLYLRIEDVPGASSPGCAAAVEEAARLARMCNARRRIDRDAVWRHKRRALEAIFAHASPGEEFSGWRSRQPEALERFGVWSVLVEDHGARWQDWPAAYRHPRGPQIAKLASAMPERITFHLWLQWLLAGQLRRAAAPVPLLQDLPIGFDPDGFDAWDWQDLLASSVSVGAPADEFNRQGQDWGLPPFVPWKLTQAGYQPFIDTIRATLQVGSGLRIDHVMGLFRLWWVPRGAGPADGAYVRYSSEVALAILALESQRKRAVVVGEDLGTVQAHARRRLAAHDVLSYRLLWFEEEDPSTWPRKAMAAVTTHDLPTVAGLWDGSDLLAQRRAGLAPNEEGTFGIRQRLQQATGLSGDDGVEEAVEGAHRLVARSPCMLLAATLDDAAAEPERPNMPGADDTRPNWSRALAMPLEDLFTRPLAGDLTAIFQAATARSGDGRSSEELTPRRGSERAPRNDRGDHR